jgi:hypothetical protein
MIDKYIEEIHLEQDLRTRTSVFKYFKSGDDISTSLIQRKCSCGYYSASRVLQNLIEDGLVEAGETIYDICKFI